VTPVYVTGNPGLLQNGEIDYTLDMSYNESMTPPNAQQWWLLTHRKPIDIVICTDCSEETFSVELLGFSPFLHESGNAGHPTTQFWDNHAFSSPLQDVCRVVIRNGKRVGFNNPDVQTLPPIAPGPGQDLSQGQFMALINLMSPPKTERLITYTWNNKDLCPCCVNVPPGRFESLEVAGTAAWQYAF
jgi:hypothetical protein